MTVTLRRLDDVHSPELANHGDVLIALPPSYASGDTRYPVVYMQDGQNLFDAATSEFIAAANGYGVAQRERPADV